MLLSISKENMLIFFFEECFRVLKNNGCLRIAVPDFKYLFEMSSFDNEYFEWKKEFFLGSSNYDVDVDQLTQADFFIREAATAKGRFYKNKVDELVLENFDNLFDDYGKTITNINSGLQFRESYTGDHITPWDYSMLKERGENLGFSRVIQSKYQGSVSAAMQGPLFDLTAPPMSLYVDLIK